MVMLSGDWCERKLVMQQQINHGACVYVTSAKWQQISETDVTEENRFSLAVYKLRSPYMLGSACVLHLVALMLKM